MKRLWCKFLKWIIRMATTTYDLSGCDCCGGEVDPTNCNTCDLTGINAVVAGTTGGTLGGGKCSTLNTTYTGLTPQGRSKFSGGGFGECSGFEDLADTFFCWATKAILTSGGSPQTSGIASIFFFEQVSAGQITIAAQVKSGGFESSRWFKKTMSFATVCDAIDFVKTTGISFSGADAVCTFEDNGGSTECHSTATTVTFGP